MEKIKQKLILVKSFIKPQRLLVHKKVTLIATVIIILIAGVIFFREKIAFLASAGADPVAYWKFDEGQGSSANDSVGSNTGTLANGNSAPTWVSDDQCISGKCLHFDGTNDYVSVAPNSQIGNLTSSFTISAWFKLNNVTGTQRIVSSYRGLSDNGFGLGTSGTNFIFTTYSVKDYISTKVILSANHWYFVTVVMDSSFDVTYYVDGVPIETVLHDSAGNANTDDDLIIGASGSVGSGISDYFKGTIDEVKIYDYARTPSQIKADYASRGATKGVSAQFGDDDLSRKLSDGLVGYWKMDEVGVSGSNWTAVDSSGNNNNGTGLGNATVGSTVPTKFGNAGYFDGNGDYLSVPYNATLAPTSAISFGGWFRVADKTQDIRIVSKTQSGGYNLGFNDTIASSLTGVVNVGGSYYYVSYSNTNISNGTWYHAMVTYDGETVKLYLNGTVVNENTNPSGAIQYGASNAFCIGGEVGATSCDAGKVFTGGIDEVRVYNRALSSDEVKALYNFAPGPVGWWKMDEASGSTTADSSGNGNNGTTTGAPTFTRGKVGNAMSTSGASQYTTIPDTDNLDYQNAMTFTFWMKPANATAVHRIFRKGNPYSGGGKGYSLLYRGDIANDPITMQFNDSVSSHTVTVFNLGDVTNTWTYITVICDKSVLLCSGYKNGIFQSSGNHVAGDYAVSDDLEISSSNTGYNGLIDDVKIYNYARTQEQIVNDMNGGHPSIGTPIGSNVLDLKMDEGYGTTVHDASPQGNDGTLGTGNSAPTWTNDGKFGKALSFDGNDNLSVIDSNSLDIGTNDFTLSAWVKTNSVSFQVIMAKGSLLSCGGGDTATSCYRLDVSATGKLGLLLEAGDGDSYIDLESSSSSSPLIADGTWHNVLASFTRSGNVTTYVDGKQDRSTSISGESATLANSSNLSIGSRANSNAYFTGSIDEVRIYPFALSADQVKAVYNQGEQIVMGATSTGLGGTSPNYSAGREYCVPGDSSTCNPPVGEWLFSEGLGGTANDTSGNGNMGNFGGGSSAPRWSSGKIGKALEFDGNDYAQTGDATVLDISGTSALTQSLWIKLNALPISDSFAPFMITETGQGSATWDKGIRISPAGKATFYVYDSSSKEAVSNTTLSIGQWYYLTGVYDGTNVYIYVNGKKDNSSAITASGTYNFTSPQAVFSFQIAGLEFTKGMVDQVRIYNYARTPAQIAWEYNHGAPIAYYNFDECTGGTAHDTSPNKNNGTITIGSSGTQTSTGTCSSGTATEAWNNGTTGKRESSLAFDGTDDYVDMGDVNAYDMTDGQDFSVSLWAKFTNFNTNHTLVAKKIGNGSTNIGYLLDTATDGTVGAYYADTTADGHDQVYKFSSKAMSAGAWHHITSVYKDNTSITIYIDGMNAGGTTNGTIGNVGDLTNAAEFRIGAESGTPELFMNGQIDDVKLFNYALTSAQVKTQMASGAVRFE